MVFFFFFAPLWGITRNMCNIGATAMMMSAEGKRRETRGSGGMLGNFEHLSTLGCNLGQSEL